MTDAWKPPPSLPTRWIAPCPSCSLIMFVFAACHCGTVLTPQNVTPPPMPHPGAKVDEHALWQALLAGESPRDAGERLGIHPKRVYGICLKWSGRGIYEYGTSADLGWIDGAAYDTT